MRKSMAARRWKRFSANVNARCSLAFNPRARRRLEGFASGRFSKQTDVQRFFKDSPHFPKDKKGHVHLSRIKEMFTRPLYAGLLDKPEWGISMQKGKHEALISVETYMKIQGRLSGKAKAPFKSDLHEDFPMRGFVRCSCCGHPMTSCWAQGRKEKYPYYMCFNKECPQRSRSIRRGKIEGAFEELLDSITPCAEVVATARAIFTDLWEEKQASASQDTDVLRHSLAQAERQSGQILTRILETDSPILISAYEKRIKELEGEKLVLQEKITRCGTPLASFDETFRTAMDFLENPRKLWAFGSFEHKIAVLKLAFEGGLPYDPEKGFQTAVTAYPIRVLKDFEAEKSEMVRSSRYKKCMNCAH